MLLPVYRLQEQRSTAVEAVSRTSRHSPYTLPSIEGFQTVAGFLNKTFDPKVYSDCSSYSRCSATLRQASQQVKLVIKQDYHATGNCRQPHQPAATATTTWCPTLPKTLVTAGDRATSRVTQSLLVNFRELPTASHYNRHPRGCVLQDCFTDAGTAGASSTQSH